MHILPHSGNKLVAEIAFIAIQMYSFFKRHNFI